MYPFSHFIPHEDQEIGSYQNQNFLSSFPISLHEQFRTHSLDSSNLTEREDKLDTEVYRKVSNLIRYLVRKCRSKKECLEMVKNMHFLNNTKEAGTKTEMIKKIAKLKLVKNSIQKEEMSNMCHGLAMDVLMGARGRE